MQQRLETITTRDGRITVSALEEIAEPQTPEQIGALAYELWQARGCPDGTPDEDWFRAEREIAGSKRVDEKEVESRPSSERSIDAGEADSEALRFPVRSELSQAAHAGASRRA
jgi:hypothetical protein